LVLAVRSPWFAGVAFAAVANIYTRSVYREFVNSNCASVRETGTAKLASLIGKVGALAFILFPPLSYAVQLRLAAVVGSEAYRIAQRKGTPIAYVP
jgi:hypothetical protein